MPTTWPIELSTRGSRSPRSAMSLTKSPRNTRLDLFSSFPHAVFTISATGSLSAASRCFRAWYVSQCLQPQGPQCPAPTFGVSTIINSWGTKGCNKVTTEMGVVETSKRENAIEVPVPMAYGHQRAHTRRYMYCRPSYRRRSKRWTWQHPGLRGPSSQLPDKVRVIPPSFSLLLLF